MPFVFVTTNENGSESLYTRIKSACKNAWTSMDLSFKDTDVGGAIHAARGLSPLVLDKVLFIYVDRGVDFNNLLRYRMENNINLILAADIDLRPIQESEAWFPDPVWSQAPCTRHHRDEYDSVPSHEGAAPQRHDQDECC